METLAVAYSGDYSSLWQTFGPSYIVKVQNKEQTVRVAHTSGCFQDGINCEASRFLPRLSFDPQSPSVAENYLCKVLKRDLIFVSTLSRGRG